MLFIVIGVILLFIFNYNQVIDARKFVVDIQPYFGFLMEDDYKFYLNVRYNGEVNDADCNRLFGMRVRNGLVVMAALFILLLQRMSFLYVIVILVVGFLVFKEQYFKLKNYYKRNLHQINLMLPYYLKSLEILIQHYTVPVALSRSINTAPDIFKSGLQKLVYRIDSGDSSVDPYMDFAKEYPVRDSMRMMRLLYRLGIGDQENKQEQLTMFSKTVSSLQNKSREQKYKDRLDKMEKKTMIMLFGTGGGIMLLLMLSMTMMMGI